MAIAPITPFVQLVEKNKSANMIVAEIGVFTGCTLLEYLPIIKGVGGKSIVVDWFLGNLLPNGIYWQHGGGVTSNHDALLQTLKSGIESIGCTDIVSIFDMTSDEGAEKMENDSLDICFIDATHTYTQCKKDIDSYLPKVKSGGILCGHDCEGFELINTFTKDQLEDEWMNTPPGLYINGGCHAGVIQAVYDSFGAIELIPDPGLHKIPIWVYKKP
jgi:hypothetical protein